MSKFQNKYRNETARAPWWNYANDGAYFITICTAGRERIFGEILNNEMYLSPIGEIVYQEWNVSFDMRTELFCDTFVIMPEPPPTTTSVAYRSPKSISSFVAGFKSAATKRINQFRKNARPCVPTGPVWQTRFHDHIIRNDDEYQRIFNYIETNIENWEKDKFFKKEEL